jgi:hypothetical protein
MLAPPKSTVTICCGFTDQHFGIIDQMDPRFADVFYPPVSAFKSDMIANYQDSKYKYAATQRAPAVITDVKIMFRNWAE